MATKDHKQLVPFKKGVDTRRNLKGTPRKYISLLREQGYRQVEVADTMQVLIAMTVEELETVKDNPKATILERIIAGALLKDNGKQSLWNSELILNRVHGKPKETIDSTITGDIKVTLKLER